MYSVLLDMVTRSVQAEQLPPLRAGAVLKATVEGAPGRLAAVSSGLRVPLPESAAFEPRQPVLIEVRDSPRGLQLVVRPAPQAPVAQQAPPAPAQQPDLAGLLRVVAQALESAGVSVPAEVAAETVPPSLPQSPPVLTQFFAPFSASTAAALADDWAALGDIAARALAAGALSRREAGVLARRADALTDAARRPSARNAATIEAGPARGQGEAVPLEARIAAALAGAREEAVPLESKIAAALASPNAPKALEELFQSDVRALLSRLRHDEAFQTFLRNAGHTKVFERAAERVLAHLTESGVQNTRSLDMPYMFMQLPLPPDGPLLRADIHVVAGGRRDRAGTRATVAFDVATARLGDLWITLTTDGEQCGCRFRARTAEAVEAVRGAAGELEAALKKAGYARASVRAELWDGDRLGALAAYLRPFSGLNVEA